MWSRVHVGASRSHESLVVVVVIVVRLPSSTYVRTYARTTTTIYEY